MMRGRRGADQYPKPDTLVERPGRNAVAPSHYRLTAGTGRRVPWRWLSAAICLALAAGNATADTPVQGATRVVAIGGSVTEIIYALGLADRLVAVDSTSRYPAGAKDKPDVGYMRALSAEPILALEPSLVLAEQDAGPPSALAQLREAGVNVVGVPDEPSPEGIIEKIRVVAAALGAQAKGEALAAGLRSQLDAARASVSRTAHRPRVLFLLSVNSGAPLAGGGGTSAQAIIELAGGVNAGDGFEGYKPISPEALVSAAPDYLLVTRRTLERLGGEAGLLATQGVGITPAGETGRIIAMDGLLLLGFGPRTPGAIAELAGHLHPEFDP